MFLELGKRQSLQYKRWRQLSQFVASAFCGKDLVEPDDDSEEFDEFSTVMKLDDMKEWMQGLKRG